MVTLYSDISLRLSQTHLLHRFKVMRFMQTEAKKFVCILSIPMAKLEIIEVL